MEEIEKVQDDASPAQLLHLMQSPRHSKRRTDAIFTVLKE